MPRKPLTDEERKARSERMKARWAEKKAQTVEQPEKTSEPVDQPKPTQETSEPVQVTENVNPADTTDVAMVTRALKAGKTAQEVMRIITNYHPDMIEARQALDALSEAVARMGQVEGLVKQNT